MDFEYKGANCIQLTTKAATVVTDPNLATVGLKDVSPAKVDVYLMTQPSIVAPKGSEAFIIDSAGEYEVKGFGIRGIAARGHMEAEEGAKGVTMYRLAYDDVKIGVTGHIYPELSDEQLETLGLIDILIIPVGGNGYTLDPIGAAKMVRKIDPKIVIPTHFADTATNYEVLQGGVEDFIKELGAPVEQVDKLKLKSGTGLPETLTVFQLKRS